MEDVSCIFMNAEETKAAVLYEWHLEKFLQDGVLKDGFCVLTDKRLYFKGRYLHNTGRSYQADRGEYTIELKDVTGSGFATTRFGIVFLLEILYVLVMTVVAGFFIYFMVKLEHYPLGLDSILWTCKVLLALGLAAVPVFYYLKPFRIFVIEYAGGKIGFFVEELLEGELVAFQRELYKAKDMYVKNNFST